MAAPAERYVPAGGRAWLTGGYDMTIALTMREDAWRPALVEAVARDLPHGGIAVEVGCGTGSLAIALATARPDASVVGIDGDPAILELARRKDRRRARHLAGGTGHDVRAACGERRHGPLLAAAASPRR